MWGRFNARLARDQELIDLVFKLKGKVAALEERADAQEAALERLRGRLYATGQHKPPEQPPPAPTGKGAILRDYFTPGRPAKHD